MFSETKTFETNPLQKDPHIIGQYNPQYNPPKTNMDTQNDGFQKVTPFKHGNCWYLC